MMFCSVILLSADMRIEEYGEKLSETVKAIGAQDIIHFAPFGALLGSQQALSGCRGGRWDNWTVGGGSSATRTNGFKRWNFQWLQLFRVFQVSQVVVVYSCPFTDTS
jgi:hypothetical protein